MASHSYCKIVLCHPTVETFIFYNVPVSAKGVFDYREYVLCVFCFLPFILSVSLALLVVVYCFCIFKQLVWGNVLSLVAGLRDDVCQEEMCSSIKNYFVASQHHIVCLTAYTCSSFSTCCFFHIMKVHHQTQLVILIRFLGSFLFPKLPTFISRSCWKTIFSLACFGH